MKLITVDFETFYDRDYSLSKLTYYEYIKNPKFEVIGFSAQIDGGEPEWFTGDHAYLTAALQSLDLENNALIAHNAPFDAAILQWHYGIRPKFIYDTLSMARAVHGTDVGGSLAKLVIHYNLGEKGTEVVNALGKRLKDFTKKDLAQYGNYCKNDVSLTYKLFYSLLPHFTLDTPDGPRPNATELKLIDMTVRMGTEPALLLDREVLEQHLTDVRDKKQRLLDACGCDASALTSQLKFANILEALGVEPPKKMSARTGKETYAFAKTDDGMKELLNHPNEAVRAVVEARLGVKTSLEETRTERLITVARGGSPLPIGLNYYGAATGRWAACLVADTQVTVYNAHEGVETKRIVDVLLDDLVWDGEEFVAHDGVVFNGFQDVITWDGVTGTGDHVVFTEDGEVSLQTAMQRKLPIKTAGSVEEHHMDAARIYISDD